MYAHVHIDSVQCTIVTKDAEYLSVSEMHDVKLDALICQTL